MRRRLVISISLATALSLIAILALTSNRPPDLRSVFSEYMAQDTTETVDSRGKHLRLETITLTNTSFYRVRDELKRLGWKEDGGAGGEWLYHWDATHTAMLMVPDVGGPNGPAEECCIATQEPVRPGDGIIRAVQSVLRSSKHLRKP